MMKYLGIALLTMFVATIATHLGLPQAIAGVVMKICKCHKCLSFWLTLLALVVIGCPMNIVAVLSILVAYLSHWLSLLLIWFNKIFERLWERLNKEKTILPTPTK